MTNTASRVEVVARIDELRRALEPMRRRQERIAFVPTMGFLHEGHLRLIDEARRRAECVVVSIFVNPLQFAPTEDLARYPRDLAGDVEKAGRRGADFVFAPAPAEMYPSSARVAVTPLVLHDRWEGAVRPGHFAGVLTVVAKLFNVVQPDAAVFGRKDVQQALLVRAMVRDLDFPLEIIVAPTCREPDGLAMSSRNSYLDADQRQRALVLSAALRAVRDAYDGGERHGPALRQIGRRVLAEETSFTADYLAVVDPVAMEEVTTAEAGTLVIVAGRLGPIRLIDNAVLGDPAMEPIGG